MGVLIRCALPEVLWIAKYTLIPVASATRKNAKLRPPRLSNAFQQCSLRGGGGWAAATFGAERAVGNGMDAPTRNGIKCAKVEVLCNHLNREERPP